MKYLKLITALVLGASLWSCSGGDDDKGASTKNHGAQTEVKDDHANHTTNTNNTHIEKKSEEKQWPADKPGEGIFAVINTDKGDVKLQLEYRKVPVTVANFIALAEGDMDNSFKKKGEPFYDGLNFHRVITKHNGDPQDFMVQGGCPLKTGAGNPGYSFQDEFDNSLKHDKPGILSMANSGPATNGSQFFITVVPTPWLNRKHSIFGHVVEGLDIITSKITKGDNINSIKIVRVGEAANAFDAMKVFKEKAVVKKR